VTPDGKVKILDFGLAKALEGDPSSSASASAPQVSHSPTMSRNMTEAGMIMGTAAYMSPEQARGKAVDKRADIWSFGVVLFEMLTGERLFKGETVSDTLAAVLREEVPWPTLPAHTPPALTLLLKRCLARDPRERLRDIGEARFALRSPADLSSPLPFAPVAADSRPTFGRRWSPVLAVAALGMVGGAFLAGRAATPVPPIVRVGLLLPTGDDMIQRNSAIAISPDGSTLAFRVTRKAKSGIFVRSLDQPEPRFVTGSEDALSPGCAT